MTEKKREELYPVIKESALAYGIGQVEAGEIDKINILQATFKAMGLAVEKLNVLPHYVLVDGRDFPRFFVDGGNKTLKGEAVVKGDGKSASVAAASVLAKVYRDHLMQEYADIYPEYDFEKHKGYGTKKHRELIVKNWPCPIHRRSFLKNILSDIDIH